MQYEMDETNFALMHKEAVFQVSARLNMSTALNMLKVNKVVAKKQPDPQIDDVEETVTPDQPSTSTPKSPEVQPKRKRGPKTKVIMCDASTQTDKEQIIELQTDKKKEVEPDAVAAPGFSPGGGANSQKCYYFSIFCRKLYENERIWTPGGARVPGAPLGSANGMILKSSACLKH